MDIIDTSAYSINLVIWSGRLGDICYFNFEDVRLACVVYVLKT